MKKLLSLLSVLTISGTSVPTVIAASPYQKENKKLLNSEFNNLKRIKRNDPTFPSLQNLITTINIGKIEKFNKKNILKRLSEINHPIVSRTDFLENIEFENITFNSAIIHARQNILDPYRPIPSSIRFTINFDSSEKINEDLGKIWSNSHEEIAKAFILRNNLNLTTSDLIIRNITNSSALIEISNDNEFSIQVYFIPINIIYSYLPEGNSSPLGRRNVNYKKESWSTSPEGNSSPLGRRNVNYKKESWSTSPEGNSSPLGRRNVNYKKESWNSWSIGRRNVNYKKESWNSSSLWRNNIQKNKKIILSSVITNTDLGTILDNRPETILRQFIKINPNSGLTVNDLIVRNIYVSNSATIEIRGLNNQSIIVRFNPSIRTLDTIIINPNLYIIPDNRPETILRQVILSNPRNNSLRVDRLRAINITSNSATIRIISENFIGSVIVNFTVDRNFNCYKRSQNFYNEKDKDNFKKRKYNYNQQNNINKQSTTTKKPSSGGYEPINKKTNLSNILINTYLGELQDNRTETILNKILKLNNNVEKNNIEIGTVIDNWASIITTPDSKYEDSVMVNFILNKNNYNKYNTLSKAEKQQKINEINQHYQNLSENNKKDFKDKLTAIGTSAIGAGISVVGTKITVSESASSTAVSTSEAIEMTPLLSEGLTAAETLSVAEGTAVVATEGAVIGAEAGTAVALAPETLGLSLVIGGLAIAGTAIIWWLSSHDNNTQAVKHESHNQYNEIEKYYKFLAHDQLKLDININEWNKIKQIYQENSNNYQEFKNKIKSEITNFHKEDHSGWGGSITDDDINTLINILYNHFQEINNHFLSNPNYGWKIISNTMGSYFIIEKE